MTIDTAIVDLSIQLEVKRRLGKDHQANTIELGIEALKLIKKERKSPHRWFNSLLPGETED